MKLTLIQQNSNSACEIALNAVTALQERTSRIQISKKLELEQNSLSQIFPHLS